MVLTIQAVFVYEAAPRVQLANIDLRTWCRHRTEFEERGHDVGKAIKVGYLYLVS